MKKINSVLDERQEAELLKVERNGCWGAFWGLLVAITVQMFMYPGSFSHIAGEWIVFMVLALYITIACLRRGIWARNFRPDAKTNLAFSGAAAVVVMILVFFLGYLRRPEAFKTCLMLGGVTGAIMFVVIFISLSIAAKSVKHRQEELDREPEDEDMDF